MYSRPDLMRLAVPLLIAAGSTAALFALRAVIHRLLHAWASRTETKLDNIILGSVHRASLFWVLATGLALGVAFSDLPDRTIARIQTVIQVLVILSVTFAGANLAGNLYGHYLQTSEVAIPAPRLGNAILKGTICIIGGLIILSVVGISIAPMLTALGVGGLAVALALQDTLANLFAGIQILVEKSLRVGDFVRLESGQEGYVEDITWRTTRIRLLSNNIVIVPNSKVSQSTLTNYWLPEKRMAVQIPVSVAYGTDPGRVEQILSEEAMAAAGHVPGLLADPPPFVRLTPGFGASSLDFTLICQVAEFTDQAVAQHELRKRILARFRSEGIEIPYPQRTVHIRGGTPGTAS